jgi:hypothetical protein
MVTRAVSARDWLTPRAVLIPMGATPLLALRAMSTAQSGVGPVLALLVLGVGFTAIVVAGRFTYGARISVVTTATGVGCPRRAAPWCSSP